jgi:hypothetical protein
MSTSAPLLPRQVFTPTQLPLAATNVYSPRAVPEGRLAKLIERSQVPLVYGEFGVGKTSLVKKFFEVEDRAGRVVHLTPPEDATISSIFSSCFEKLGYEIVRSSSTSVTTSSQAGLDLRLLSGARQKATTKGETREPAVSLPTLESTLRYLNDHQLVVILDEFHKTGPALRRAVVSLIKSINTLGLTDLVIVIVGSSQDPRDLVLVDEGVDRIIKEIKVPLMTKEEARFIVSDGMKKLQLGVSDDLVDRLVKISACIPTIVHSICLDAAENCISENRSTISEVDVLHGVKLYVEEHGRRMYNVYVRAVPTTGPKRYRKLILHAVAESDNELVTMAEIVDYVSRVLGEEVPSHALSGELRALKSEFGKPLKDVEGVGTEEDRQRDLTAFRDPALKYFVRFMGNVERGL